MSKAFDKVCHAYLFDILLKRGVPIYVINLLQKWYSRQKMAVRWGDALSGEFTVSCGVKQGSLLSPHLFNLYLDELSCKLNKCKIGCAVADPGGGSRGSGPPPAPRFFSSDKTLKLRRQLVFFSTIFISIYKKYPSICLSIYIFISGWSNFRPTGCLSAARETS